MQTPAIALLKLSLLGYLVGGLGGIICFRWQRRSIIVAFSFALLASASGLAASILFLTGESGYHSVEFNLIPSLVPYLQYSIRLDPLSAFFLMVSSALALPISFYSLGYVRVYLGRKNVAVLGGFFNALMFATALVFLAANAFCFLIAWEIMALTAFCLVSFEHEKAETRNAGLLYFIMSHVGTGCLILGFLLLFQATNDYSFSGFHNLGPALGEGRRNEAFLLFLAGFGVKAGIVPVHIWLPAAHPVAPTNVSALMSAVLIKTGIYGLTRVLFDFLGVPPMWWGVTILVLGSISALLGVLYALMEHDLKRLLAYHSIENIGIILMGLGAAMMFLHTGHGALASIALIAALFHTFNHAAFKGLLFLGSGAVLHSTHTRNMEEMGGLIKSMPWTSLFFLIGAVAISALPPLNGFVSEWLTYQSLLQGFQTTTHLVRLVFPLGAALLALTGALAAACFVKAFGITFLAQPRSHHAAGAHEVSWTMLMGMALLTGLCIYLGLFLGHFLSVFDPVTNQFMGQALSQRMTASNGIVLDALEPGSETISTLGLALTGICLLPLPLTLWWLLGRGAVRRIGPTWDCGLKGLTPHMEYTATGFSKPLRMIFKALFRPRRDVQREYDYSPYFATTLRFESHIEETFERRIYRPLQRFILRTSRRFRALQAGSLHAYLIYILLTLIFLLLLIL